MFVVSIRYPRKEGEEFNFQHWAEVHMPMGLAIYKRHNDLAPEKVMIQHDTFGMDGQADSTDAYATVWLLFKSKAGLDGFIKLHSDAVASAPLAEDFQYYAPEPPHLAFGELTVFDDIDAVLSKGEAVLN